MKFFGYNYMVIVILRLSIIISIIIYSGKLFASAKFVEFPPNPSEELCGLKFTPTLR